NRTLSMQGSGIISISGAPTLSAFGAVGDISFRKSSTAGNAIINSIDSGYVQFFNSSSAASSKLGIDSLSAVGFFDTSTAGNAAISSGGSIDFHDTTTAGNATIINSSVFLYFHDTSSAGSATITTNAGAKTRFFDQSTGGGARFITVGNITVGNGVVDFSQTL